MDSTTYRRISHGLSALSHLCLLFLAGLCAWADPVDWTRLPPHRFDQMTPKPSFIVKEQFHPAEMVRIAGQYYSFFESAYARAGGLGFVLVGEPTPAQRSRRVPGLSDHARSIAIALSSSLPPYNLDAAGVQAALLARGWLVHWENVLLENPSIRGPSARSCVLNLVCGRVRSEPWASEAPLADLTGPAATVERRLHRLGEEEVPPYVRVWELTHPGRRLGEGFRRVEPAGREGESFRGVRSSRWDPLGACCLVFPRPGVSEAILLEKGLAGGLEGEEAFWRAAAAAEVEAEQAFLVARPLLVARRMLDHAGKPAGPGRAAAELALAAKVRDQDETYRRNLPEYQSLAGGVARAAGQRVEELMLVSLLRAANASPATLRGTAALLAARLPAHVHAARILASAIAPLPTDRAGTLVAWSTALSRLPDPEALAEGSRVLNAIETPLRAAVAKPGGGGLFAEP